MGAAGTGSNSVECGELFVPEHRMSRRIADVFKLLQVGDMGYAFTAALPLGMARHALEAFHDPAKGRGIRMLGYEKMYDSAVVQTAVATAHTTIKMIEAYQHWVLSTLQPGAERITALESLALYGDSAMDEGRRLDDHALSMIANLPSLEYLSLLDGAYTEHGLRQLRRLPKLGHLHVEREGPTAPMFRFAAAMPALTRLSGLDEFGDDGPMPPAEVQQVRAMLPHIAVG